MKNSPFKTYYQEFIYKSRYSRWLDDQGRRENWDETVYRYLNFITTHLKDNYNYTISGGLWDELYNAIYDLEVMPSMRALMTAGKALERSNVAGFNCSYLPVDDAKAFDEAMYILMCGAGVGFSVERQFITKLPEVPDQLFDSDTKIIVKDSKEGWSKGLRQLIALLYSGEIPKWDLGLLRPAGARLKTFGGRASGPEPLDELFRFVVSKFRGSVGRKLNSTECHDIMCKIGEVVVVGGVRRSAMISLSNLTDDRMRRAKSGTWWENEVQRALANNSVAYTEKPDVGAFMKEWLSLYESKSGERGIFNRVAAIKKVQTLGRDDNWEFGTNPCGEIILRPYQFCNLTEVVIRSTDSIDDLKRKVYLATILGTFQSTLTDFPYLRKIWKKNTEEERLLGVSLTGIMDNTLTNGIEHSLGDRLIALREVAWGTNKEFSGDLGINPSTAITCVKPSGTVSQLVDSASGIHTRHSPYYIRSVRADNKDPLTEFMKASGVPNEPDVTKPESTTVFSFPIKSPKDSLVRDQQNAIDALELWRVYQQYWTDHNPSITVNVRESEWPEVGGWVYSNFNSIAGVSFLPHTEHIYKQAPYQEVNKNEYDKLVAAMPDNIDWDKLSDYEKEDNTAGTQTLACSGDSCEIVDLV